MTKEGMDKFVESINLKYRADILYLEEVSQILGVSKQVLYKMTVKRISPPYFLIGTKKAFLKAELFKWIKANHVNHDEPKDKK